MSFSGETECTIEKSTLDLGIQHTLSYLFDDHYVFYGRRRTYSCVVFLSMHQRSTLFSTGRTSSIPRRSRRPPGQIEAHPSLKRGRGRLLGFGPPPRRNPTGNGRDVATARRPRPSVVSGVRHSRRRQAMTASEGPQAVWRGDCGVGWAPESIGSRWGLTAGAGGGRPWFVRRGAAAQTVARRRPSSTKNQATENNI